jgi:prepilin-type N-terminal cleavage/methylation domain-containing protein
MHIQNPKMRGFTLVELLIVVIILAILAAIIVPQFADSANDARQSAYSTDLGNLRAVVELYRQQHGSYPGAVAATAGTCVNGAAVVSAVGSASFATQLTRYTNAAGQACTGFDATQFRFGPYLREGIPANPLGTSNTVTVVTAGILGITSAATGGWRFDSVTGELIGDQ